MHGSITNGSVDQPAKIARPKLPGRAFNFLSCRASFDFPARLGAFSFCYQPGYQKKDLPLYVSGYGSPALFVTVDCLQRGPEQFGHLLLGLIQSLAEFFKFVFVHNKSPLPHLRDLV
jgi:hypothetical protein